MKHEELTKDIIGAAMVVWNELKPGLDEKLDTDIAQMLGYLRITGLEVAPLVNFKEAKLTWKRVVSGVPEENHGWRG